MLHQEITISKFKLCTSFLIIPKMFCFFFWLWLFWERFFSLCLYYSQLIWGWLLLLIWCLMLHNHWWHHRCIFVCLSRPAGILFNGISSGQSLMNIIVSLYRSCLSSRMWFSNLLLQQVQWFKRATHKRFFFYFCHYFQSLAPSSAFVCLNRLAVLHADCSLSLLEQLLLYIELHLGPSYMDYTPVHLIVCTHANCHC